MQLKYYLQFKNVLNRSQIKQDFFSMSWPETTWATFFLMLEQNNHWQIYKIRVVWAVFLDNYAQNLASKWAVWAAFERFKKTLKNRSRLERFERFFLRQLRSKSCFKMSGLSGFWTVYLKKPLKNRARFERFWAVYLKNRSKTAQDLNGLERFF